MFKFNNTHIFTGYLKQKLSTINIPTCKIYTREFAEYLKQNLVEDPRVIESFDGVLYNGGNKQPAVRTIYLKNGELYTYFLEPSSSSTNLKNRSELARWKKVSNIFYDSDKFIPGLTKTLHSPGHFYDVTTHEYLGDYLRFLRDYYDINLMSMYNCFNNSICNNIAINFYMDPETRQNKVTFNSQDTNYNIYAIPVKLFENYTIAIDSHQGFELFCGLYNTRLNSLSDSTHELARKTYQKVHKAIFKQPILYTKLDVSNWLYEAEFKENSNELNTRKVSRWDIINQEQDLKLFIKVPKASKSSIVILEGDFRSFNDTVYSCKSGKWQYKYNRSIINFDSNSDINRGGFKPISKLQLLEFNTGESYPFAERLVEYLSGSAITSIEDVPDNIIRVQEVMRQNNHHFKINGVWENKIQQIIYDYIMNSGPIKNINGELQDKREGYHRQLGLSSKSDLYDILGYVDKDAEKWYASWKTQKGTNKVQTTTIQNVDIYNGLYDI